MSPRFTESPTAPFSLRSTRSLALAAVAALALAGCGSSNGEGESAPSSPAQEESSAADADTGATETAAGTEATDATDETTEATGEAGGSDDADPDEVIAEMRQNLQQAAVEACFDEMWGEDLLRFSASHLNTANPQDYGPVQLNPTDQQISGAQGFGCSFTTGVAPEETRSGSTQVFTADDPATPLAECDTPVAEGEAVREDAEGVSEFVNSGPMEGGGSLITHAYVTCSEDATSMVIQTLGYEADSEDAEPPYDTAEVDELITALAEDTSADGERRDAWRDIELSDVGQ
ncbi:MAG: hypothetical protein ACTHZ5_04015 [Micrococcaceae bacterium]